MIKFKKVLANLLAVAVVANMIAPSASATLAAEPSKEVPKAAGVTSPQISNPGFEDADLIAAPGGNAARDTQKWYQWNGVRVTDTVRTGTQAVRFNASPDSSIEMDLEPLTAGKTYTFSIWAKGNEPATKPFIGVKNLSAKYHNGEINTELNVNADTWTQNKITFEYESGNPRVYLWAPDNSANQVYLDDAALTEGYLPAPETGNLLKDPSFETKALSSSANAQVDVWNNYNYTIKNEAVGHGGKIVVSDPAKESTMTQAVAGLVPGAKYEFSIWAKKNADAAGNAAPVIGVKNHGSNEIQNALQLNNDGSWTRNSVVFTYEGTANAEVFVYTPAHSGSMNLQLDAANLLQIAEPAVTPSPEVPPVDPDRAAGIFYVSNGGDDANEGTSPEAAFKTIDHLNTLHFVPGDQILFKKGEVFKGTFKPHGSGTPQNPVVIKSYGDAAAKPILEPGKAWRGKIMKAGGNPNGGSGTPCEEVNYSGCIWLENVEGYEVRDLELRNPQYDPNNHRVNEFKEFTAGVRVMNNNAGDLHYFVFDNLTIHGFRGPGSNFGKSAGGIQFNVLVDPNHLVEETGNVKSASHDIQITNCEIYNCGRSGVNFLNPWGRRQPKDGKWENATEGVLPWYPYTNFYMANNVLHHIDGDALIVDNVSNAVVEKNLCYETAIHLSGGTRAAVGFFNWNSDDTYFQYNEVFNVGKAATRQDGNGEPFLQLPGDAQGIEIDALNDRSWVQHNYVHDNYGGFMMWCNLSRVYPSYDGIIRYNISENDYVKEHGLFDSFQYQYGSETYNNAFIMNPETALRDGVVRLFHNNQNLVEQHKMYNNIFYLTGETPYPVNSFSDNNFDWQSNIFYNFTGLPVNDNPAHPNIAISKEQLAANPLFVKPGLKDGAEKFPTAYRGLAQMREALKGYEIQEGSPAVKAGVPLKSMEQQLPDGMNNKIAMTDFFGNPVTGTPDIGVHQSTFAAPPRVSSNKYDVDPIEKVITVPYGTTADQLLNSLNVTEGAEKQLTKSGSAQLENTDTLTVTMGSEKQVYKIFVNTLMEIPASDHTVADGNHNSDNEVGNNVLLDDNSLWHTNWSGTDLKNMWLSLTIPTDKYMVTGLTYLPRQDGSPNGTITKYRIEGRNNDKEQWTAIANGDWANNSSRKDVKFDKEQTYSQYRLVALATVGQNAADANKYASAQEVRLLGYAKTVEPTAPHTEAATFYVSATGKDTNNGTTPETAFKTINHLNKIQFVPGDKILFKKGDVFTGTFKPQGSGTAEKPIVISSYGDAAKKPVLEPGASWSGLIMKAGGNETYVEKVTYNGTIWLENVEGYEVRGLELRDPDYNASDNRVNEFTEYTAGIRVVNDNAGDLHHYVFDDLTIHGFRGPGSNLGKSSGGIQFNVMVDPNHKNDPDANTPSAMHDITVTNNEIYNCGRSGINFLNPWGRRQPVDGKWEGVTEGKLPWHAFSDFYVANNVFHHIDGDAMIIDNVSNSVVEKNLCYETAIHLGAFGAAVGFFNWNSDDTYFQYNEVFNIGKDATAQDGKNAPVARIPGDGQGIEIDALNDRTWVQHNYVHDNYGGFMMWCNPNNYPSYDGIVRYNISENEHANVHGVFDSRPDQHGSETYNNAIIMNPETALKDNKVNIFGYGSANDVHKMYNNIFYLTGDRAYPANSFADGSFDWQSNIFYNITNLPVNDNPAYPNIAISKDQLAKNPLFVKAGLDAKAERFPTAYRGLKEMREALKGYQIQKESPAVKAGVILDSMKQQMPDGMDKKIALTDFFGNPVTGIPDIGVHQSDYVVLRINSTDYVVDSVEKVITVPYGTTADQLINSLVAPEGVVTKLTKSGNEKLENTDTLTATLGDQKLIYTIKADKLMEIPASDHTATAGNHNESSKEVADNVLKDDNSLWHTDWNGTSLENMWLTLEIPADKYVVTGITYLPRQDGNPNGSITKYRIEGRNVDSEEWTPITNGDWAADKTRKTVEFTPEQNYSQYRLVALETSGKTAAEANKFASAQEVRLLGYPKVTEPVVSEVTVTFKVDGIEDQIVKVTKGQAIGNKMPENPAKDGYVFKHFADEKGNVVTAETVADSDMIVSAVFNKLYTVTYTDGVASEELFADQITTVEEGEATPAFKGENPVREGYVFDGWDPVVAETVTADAVYTAKWRDASVAGPNVEIGNQSYNTLAEAVQNVKDGETILVNADLAENVTLDKEVEFTLQAADGVDLSKIELKAADGFTLTTAADGAKLKVTVKKAVGPTVQPTIAPTVKPTVEPTTVPTVKPTVEPTTVPTVKPTVQPTTVPTVKPTVKPTVVPVKPTTAPARPVVTVTPGHGGGAQTGDATGVMGWMSLTGLMAAGIFLALRKLRRDF